MFTLRTKSRGANRVEQGFVISGQFVGRINSRIKVPRGEKGLLFMRDFLRRNYRKKHLGEPAFTEGFVGFLSYDLGAKWMGIGNFSRKNLDQETVECPEAYFVYVDKVVDLQRGTDAFVENILPAGGGSCIRRHREAVHVRPSDLAGVVRKKCSVPRCHITFNQYCKKICAIKNYLYSGDTYQVNFSQKFEVPYFSNAFSLYEKTVQINPSPHQFFLETSDFAVISNSPERLFKIQNTPKGRIIETRPIKGTCPRGKNPQEDKKNIARMLASEKEKAELAMIVDLERNDLGKICKPGTVEVNKNRVVEKYSHVIHTVSNIRGILEPQYDWYDALYALFPGGSVTGCPKKRTMEIIQKLEREPRGVYCGSAGFIDLSGECDFNIMIRTLYLDKNKKSPKIIFRSGGGIVVDSDPQREYEETLHKSQALINAISV